ncbi:MAG: hypothetical protein ACD_62C00593G0004 [uncultured bacterium]|nr:MAG: hypothetical protein ACD_62C00593G0004 [uncultured bacterium]
MQEFLNVLWQRLLCRRRVYLNARFFQISLEACKIVLQFVDAGPQTKMEKKKNKKPWYDQPHSTPFLLRLTVAEIWPP